MCCKFKLISLKLVSSKGSQRRQPSEWISIEYIVERIAMLQHNEWKKPRLVWCALAGSKKSAQLIFAMLELQASYQQDIAFDKNATSIMMRMRKKRKTISPISNMMQTSRCLCNTNNFLSRSKCCIKVNICMAAATAAAAWIEQMSVSISFCFFYSKHKAHFTLH